jgi:hypothetical protein
MRLIPHLENLQPDHLHDLMIIMAKNVEDSLLDCGATPGVDYTILDLYKLASPLVAERWQNQDLQYTTQWKAQ